jgi:hypothetical protein
MAACDLDGDLLPEIYIANDFGPDLLLHNLSVPGHLRFQRLLGQRPLLTPASTVLDARLFKGMGVDCGDLNHDGILIWQSAISHRSSRWKKAIWFS